jgi:hypothetical protein
VAEAKILDSIKKLLGIAPEYDVFDDEIIIHINSVFSVMHQLGAAPLQGFLVVDGTETWDQYIGDAHHVQMIKTLTYMKVRLIFDPPASSSVLNSFESQIKELEWRLSIMEIQWNPDAYAGLGLGEPTTYVVPTGGDFPEDAPDNSIGIDPVTGDVWQEV